MSTSRGKKLLACCLVGNVLLAAACTENVVENADNNSNEENAVSTTNGLSAINGLSALNGLSAINGLSALNGLSSTGLVSGSTLMNTSQGRDTVSYMVRCALPAGHSITKKDQNGVSYTFPGQIGLAPTWENGTCDSNCQQYISSCMMAHVNTSGQHIALWIVGDSSAIGWGTSGAYPYQEGSFFGNIFSNPPSAFYCDGEDFDLGVVPGRLGATQSGAPYKDPFGTSALCSRYCTANSGGYSNCDGFSHVITVYRDWDPNTDYKVCSRKSGLCMTLDKGGTTDGTRIDQAAYSSSADQKFRITAVGTSQYKICSTKSG
ncbi:MAG TPA: RICIN domain-containing protein, partial [Polyangiaceae bacterium]